MTVASTAIAIACAVCVISSAFCQEASVLSNCEGDVCRELGTTTRRGCDRWYISLSGGTAQRETVHELSDSRTFIRFAPGFATNGALGYRFDLFRLDVESSFMNNRCTEAGAGGAASSTTGNVNLRSLMFNGYRDFQFGEFLWKPYAGIGIGFYQSQINGLNPDFFNAFGPPFAGTPVNATSDIPFAYQVRVGASRALGERAEFFTGYRYFHGDALTFAAAPFASFSPVFKPDGAELHNAEFGIRIRF
jgi:opacity protein-like surface antigen